MAPQISRCASSYLGSCLLTPTVNTYVYVPLPHSLAALQAMKYSEHPNSRIERFGLSIAVSLSPLSDFVFTSALTLLFACNQLPGMTLIMLSGKQPIT